VLLGFPRPRQWPGRLKDSRGYAKRPTAYAGASLNEHLDEAKDTPAGTAARIKSKVSGYCAKAWAVLGTLAGPLQVQELKWEAGARLLNAGGGADQQKAKHVTPGIIAVMGCNRA
jgi:hypothetical protein